MAWLNGSYLCPAWERIMPRITNLGKSKCKIQSVVSTDYVLLSHGHKAQSRAGAIVSWRPPVNYLPWECCRYRTLVFSKAAPDVKADVKWLFSFSSNVFSFLFCSWMLLLFSHFLLSSEVSHQVYRCGPSFHPTCARTFPSPEGALFWHFVKLSMCVLGSLGVPVGSAEAHRVGLQPRVSESVCWGWSPKIYISNRFPGEAAAVAAWRTSALFSFG